MKLSTLQRQTLARVAKAHAADRWYRAEGSGERVTLASLYSRGLLVRQAHRGIAGAPNAAHEYKIAPALHELITLAKEHTSERAKP